MGVMATVTGYFVDKFRGGSKDLSISKIKAEGNDDTVLNCLGPGIEFSPADGERLVIRKVNNSNSYMVAIGGINQNIEPDCDRGERRIYSVSSDGAEIKAIAKFKNDGVIELNGASDSAVLFSELKTGFDKLVEDHNDLVSKFSSHIHVTTATIGASPTPGVISPISTIVASSTASIDSSESENIKLS